MPKPFSIIIENFIVTNFFFIKSKTEHYALNHFFKFFFITFLGFFFLQRVFFEILKLTFEIFIKKQQSY